MSTSHLERIASYEWVPNNYGMQFRVVLHAFATGDTTDDSDENTLIVLQRFTGQKQKLKTVSFFLDRADALVEVVSHGLHSPLAGQLLGDIPVGRLTGRPLPDLEVLWTPYWRDQDAALAIRQRWAGKRSESVTVQRHFVRPFLTWFTGTLASIRVGKSI